MNHTRQCRRVIVIALLQILASLVASFIADLASAQVMPPATQPNLKDDRLAFLTVQLSSIEESLKAVDLAIKRTGYKVQLDQEKVKQYEKGNELMDRKGGGPMPWDQFYGRTADKFFYHPTDPNTKYRFGNNNPAGLAPVPAPQRPPQLDYFYQANKTQADHAAAEAAALGSDIQKLLQRRRDLESEQSAMWATIATEAIGDVNIPLRPLYRFRLHSTTGQVPDARQSGQLAVVRAMALFIRQVDQSTKQLHDTVSSNQEVGYAAFHKDVQAAHQQLQRDVLAQPLASSPGDDGQRIGTLLAQAKRLRSLSTNTGDAFAIQAAADGAGDESRHRTARGQLQEAVLGSAEVVLSMHQDLAKLAADWGIDGEAGIGSPDVLPNTISNMNPSGDGAGPNSHMPATKTGDVKTVPSPAAGPLKDKPIDVLGNIDLHRDVVDGRWTASKDGLTCDRNGKIRLPYTPGKEYDVHVEFTSVDGGRLSNVVLKLSQGGHSFSWMMGGWNNLTHGFGRINGKNANQNVTTVRLEPALKDGQRYSCVVQVRSRSVTAFIDGKKITGYETDFGDMSEQPAWVIDGPLGMGCNTRTIFHVIEVVPVTGDGKLDVPVGVP